MEILTSAILSFIIIDFVNLLLFGILLEEINDLYLSKGKLPGFFIRKLSVYSMGVFQYVINFGFLILLTSVFIEKSFNAWLIFLFLFLYIPIRNYLVRSINKERLEEESVSSISREIDGLEELYPKVAEEIVAEYAKKEPFYSLREEIIEKYSFYETALADLADDEDVFDVMEEKFNKLNNLIMYAIKEKYTQEELNHNIPVMRTYLGLPEKS
jgi:hypothetical protein